jgi:uncharacterized SAM-binding protein YcdF (DUF218 family)
MIDIITIILAIIGIIYLLKFPEKLAWPTRRQRVVYFLAVLLSLNMVVQSIIHLNGMILIPLVVFLLFFFTWRREKRRVLNGLLFNLFLALSALFIVYMGMFVAKSVILFIIAVVMMFTILFVALSGILALAIFFLENARVVSKKEGRSLANMLTLILGVGLVILMIIELFLDPLKFPEWVRWLMLIPPLFLGYYGVVFANFFTASVIYHLNRPKPVQDFIVVLGAGLLNGRTVTPLLSQRVDKAIRFKKQQFKETGKVAKLIMSGGQGPDEQVSEAQAMKEYAVEQCNVSDSEVVLEDKSTTTYENMLFSKNIIGDKQAIFSTNEYHVFRASLFAKQVGLNAQGIGSKTAFYFVPNAFLREFVAIVLLKKKRHLIVNILIVLFIVVMALIQKFFVI